MRKVFDVLIIGAGASGSICAIKAKERFLNVALIDENFYPCKKLLVTGNGRCNLTNKKIYADSFNRDIKNYLNRFSIENTLKFFNDLGLLTYTDDEGRVYPISNMAKSVVDVLNYKIQNLSIPVFSQETVVDILNEDHCFKVNTISNFYYAKKVVIAFGGNQVYDICKNYNVKTKQLIPSLVALKTDEKTSSLSGLRIGNVKLTANIGDKIFEQNGEVLFKESGISGIVVFNLSAYFARHGEFKGRISIDLLPELSYEECFKMIKSRVEIFDKLKDLFTGLFANAIANELISRCKLDFNIKSAELNDYEIKKICDCIKLLTFNINGCYDNNQVFSGGVLLEDLDSNLQSKSTPGLYFCGEVCDVDGVCGGYNLQWAWTSGSIVGENI